MWDIVGHERVVEGLQRLLAGDRVPHALLFTGPVAVGKTRMALELAKALNCEGESPPCGVCVHCRQIEAGSHPDVSVIEPAESKESITVDQVRALRDVASLRPFQGRMKVYVLAGAEALTPQAADALLKTLEEPQPQVTLILTAADVGAVPATVVSRCRVVPLGPVDRVTIERALEARGQSPETATRIARLAQGRVGWALHAATSTKTLQSLEEAMSRLARLSSMSLDDRLQLAEDLAGERKDRTAVRRHLELLLLLTRDRMFASQGLEPQLSDGLQGDAARADRLSDVHAALRGIGTAMQRIDQNVDPRLALEALFLELP